MWTCSLLHWTGRTKVKTSTCRQGDLHQHLCKSTENSQNDYRWIFLPCCGGLKNAYNFRLLRVGPCKKNCLPSPHFITALINQRIVQSLPLHCLLGPAACFNLTLTCSDLWSPWITGSPSRGLKELLGHFSGVKCSACPCVKSISKHTRSVLSSHSSCFGAWVLGYICRRSPRALPGC